MCSSGAPCQSYRDVQVLSISLLYFSDKSAFDPLQFTAFRTMILCKSNVVWSFHNVVSEPVFESSAWASILDSFLYYFFTPRNQERWEEMGMVGMLLNLVPYLQSSREWSSSTTNHFPSWFLPGHILWEFMWHHQCAINLDVVWGGLN